MLSGLFAGVVKTLGKSTALARAYGVTAVLTTVLSCAASVAQAGNYSIDWDTLAYPATTLAPPAPDFVLTDQYGYQVRMALVFPTTNYTGISNPDEDTVYLGGINDIFFGNDPPAGSGGFGENTRTATMNIYQTGTTTNVPVNGLNFLITDIDPIDTNTATDRCDFITATGNNGNPTLTYVNGVPTGNGTNTTFLIGPSTGTGTSGTNANSRTIFTKTGGGTARTNLNFAANQAHCLYYTNTTSTTSDNVNTGSLRATYPDATSRATINFDEVIENALGSATPGGQNASGRGIGVFGGGGFSIASSITLDKQTTTTDFGVAGDVINYSFIVTNVGPVPMNSGQNIQINDSKIGLINCPAIPPAGIAVGGTHTCTASYTVTAADVTAGTVSNTATAGVGTGTQAFASRLQSNNDTVIVPRRPTLTLVKALTNDNGGTATLSAFTLQAAGPTPISGISGAVAVTNASVTAGTYTLSETAVAGYAASAWSCTAGTLTGSSLVLANGQNATCAISNNDIGPVLTLVKTITGDGSPSGIPSFTLAASGPVVVSGATGDAAITGRTVSAGVYTLSETGPAGYAAGTWSCTSGSLAGASLTLDLGQTATCTINNVKLPTLTLRKISNGGVGSFAFSGGNGVPNQSIVTTTAGSTFTGTLATLTAASTQTIITETMPDTFWQIQSATCTGMGAGGTATLSGNDLTLDVAATAAGSNIVCTFTNRRRPTVSVQKVTTGGTGGQFSFTDLNLTGTVADISTSVANSATPASPPRLIATATGSSVTLTESSPLTFVTAGVTCSDANSLVSGNTNPVATSTTGAVSIPAAAVRVGADINCVFTNALAVPQLSVIKSANVASVSSAGATITYTIAVSNTGNTTLASIAVTDPLGPVVCPSSGAATITSLLAGASENCTLSYVTPQSAFDGNGGGDGDIDNMATAAATYNAAPVSANGSTAVAVVVSPGLTIVKLANTAGPVNANDNIGYTYRVTNTGNVTVNNVTISDSHNGFGTAPVPANETMFNDVAPLADSSDAANNASWDSLAPGDTIVFSSSYNVVQADIDNLQ